MKRVYYSLFIRQNLDLLGHILTLRLLVQFVIDFHALIKFLKSHTKEEIYPGLENYADRTVQHDYNTALDRVCLFLFGIAP